MNLQSGAKLGPYEIISAIGQGGMGEVWKARDTRINRDVAIKTSRHGFSGRFQKEAEAVAALNHPNICTLYDVGPDYLVMEFIAGSTLAERIAQGALPPEEALGIAKQIADALEAAHEKNIIHRDLKPANVKIRPDGSVKVLDFGLARIGEPSETTGDSPTLLTLGTQAGVILGTAGYMSPEQARGQVADRRADIWAFGVVLYEMVTGRRLFDGATVTDSLAAILNKEPDCTEVPEKLRRLLVRCLEKDSKKRLRWIGDWEELLPQPPVAAKARSSKLPWALLLLALAGLLAAVTLRVPASAPSEARLDVVTAPTISPSSFALSPDGRSIAYVANNAGASQLWIRPLDSLTAKPLPGTDNALYPSWSPDNRSLVFFADSRMRRVDVSGGQPQTLGEAPVSGAGTAWTAEGTILFNPTGPGPLLAISATGGTVTVATALAKGEASHTAPRLLPGDRQFLFARQGSDDALWLGSLDGKEARRITPFTPATDSPAEFLAPDWLVRVKGGALTAQRFSTSTGQLSGDPITLVPAVGLDALSGKGYFSASPMGTVAWRSGASAGSQLQWFNRTGEKTGTWGPPETSMVVYPEIAPDGNRVAVSRGGVGLRDVWLEDSTRSSRLTFDPADDVDSVWSPDGRRLVFTSSRKGVFDLYTKAVDGSGPEQVLVQSADAKRPTSWSPDGRFVLYASSEKNGDLMIVPMAEPQPGAERKPYPFLSTPFNESMGVFSPDGKWVAYQSNESGRVEIYVRPFPGPGGQWQVSTGGGRAPRWRPDGRELYYLTIGNQLMAVAVAAQDGRFVPGTPQFLFQAHPGPAFLRQQYDVSRDGRFLIAVELQDTVAEPIHLLLNWRPPK